MFGGSVGAMEREGALGFDRGDVDQGTAARGTQVSSLPYSSTARSATAFTRSYSEVSAGTEIASPPSAWISLTRESSPSSPRAETTTLAPLRANRRAVSRPMPLEAPIRTTTCSSIGLSCILIAPCSFSPVLRTYYSQLFQKETGLGAP